MPDVPPERDIPHEVPWREVEHDLPDDLEAWPWEAGRYSVGHVRETERFVVSDEDEALQWEELEQREAARKKLGGFGFRAQG